MGLYHRYEAGLTLSSTLIHLYDVCLPAESSARVGVCISRQVWLSSLQAAGVRQREVTGPVTGQ